ncbi:MAG TPA: glycogen/starch/alpha-glucan phosphorylase [Polyangiaceae bacterium]|jgi:starch phosphorylase|nr:glycogen/starch/alpha-glucan phosphorylase [Polyangiaceae bacterium]
MTASVPPSWTEPLEPGPGLDEEALRCDFVRKLNYELAKFQPVSTRNDHYLALAYVVRDRLLHHWVHSARTYLEGQHRTVAYLSAEYLIGPQLGLNLMNLGIEGAVRGALQSLGLELDELLDQEEEPGLGNGGLGRLAACFMESLGTLHYPAIGYGIRYEYGIFDQDIRDGWQLERADRWLRFGNPWEVRRHELQFPVGFGGHTERVADAAGNWRMRWVPERIVLGVPHDTPLLGPGTSNANFLRLWGAIAPEEFDLAAFQAGDYRRATDAKVRSENIAKVLYPNDVTPAGKQLRLEQQLFFVSCSLQDMIRLLLQRGKIRNFADKFAIQLNDTHPSLAVAELMRLLLDEHGLGWDEAWSITTRAFSYTNHTLLPEALEVWPLPLFSRLLPRHLEIILEINRRFLEQLSASFPGDVARLRRCSIIDENGEKSVRMAHLATIASHTINGVSKLHSNLLRETVLRDFAELWPERFTNVTNGISFARFLQLANPRLSQLLQETLGERCFREPERLQALAERAEDAGFRERWAAVKHANKSDFAAWLAHSSGTAIDPGALLDMQCKRIHEYKRQHLNLLHVIWLYDRIRRGEADVVPRTIVFAGKAAPDYFLAKLMIRLIHAVAATIAADPRAREQLRVVFVPDFNVQNAQRLYPAADLSEQISTAGHEASGTGNMKLALNGALTIGTLDGANVEIREAVGADNFFLFGLSADEVRQQQRNGYDPRAVIASDPELAGILWDIGAGRFSPGEPQLFAPLLRSLTERDPFFVLADFRAYVACQARVAKAFLDPASWWAASIRNVAALGRFSADRAVREYASRIWRVRPVPVPP